jgi:hypothetical protein
MCPTPAAFLDRLETEGRWTADISDGALLDSSISLSDRILDVSKWVNGEGNLLIILKNHVSLTC